MTCHTDPLNGVVIGTDHADTDVTAEDCELRSVATQTVCRR